MQHGATGEQVPAGSDGRNSGCGHDGRAGSDQVETHLVMSAQAHHRFSSGQPGSVIAEHCAQVGRALDSLPDGDQSLKTFDMKPFLLSLPAGSSKA